ncbi:MAG: twin-arginine translocation signal domain-containing protein [Deltaproteobacteria bacterium]|nr:twin-arginine translocation signal domain-containing protein [Deltaproteobacteria bacterium]
MDRRTFLKTSLAATAAMSISCRRASRCGGQPDRQEAHHASQGSQAV